MATNDFFPRFGQFSSGEMWVWKWQKRERKRTIIIIFYIIYGIQLMMSFSDLNTFRPKFKVHSVQSLFVWWFRYFFFSTPLTLFAQWIIGENKNPINRLIESNWMAFHQQTNNEPTSIYLFYKLISQWTGFYLIWIKKNEHQWHFSNIIAACI